MAVCFQSWFHQSSAFSHVMPLPKAGEFQAILDGVSSVKLLWGAEGMWREYLFAAQGRVDATMLATCLALARNILSYPILVYIATKQNRTTIGPMYSKGIRCFLKTSLSGCWCVLVLLLAISYYHSHASTISILMFRYYSMRSIQSDFGIFSYCMCI